ncbi:MAG: LysR family transcriptional regulator [Halioglobus sp.]|nr:LysR family transcriptional regulator [Halioglobus sp.]
MNRKSSLRDWADIRLFLAILDHGSLVAAAEQLGLTQPTVGRRLAALEARFDTPLFVRAGRRMQLTDAGDSILESARRMEREMLAIERSLEVQSKALVGEVTISATEGTGTQWLTPVLRDFHRRYPEIVVKVQIDNRTVDLLHREADIALRLGQPTQGELIARRLASVGFGLYASPDYLAELGTPTRVEDLATHHMVGLDAAGTRIDSALAFPTAQPLPGNYVYLSNSPAAQLSAVQCGLGIGVISHRWAAMVDGLVRVLPDFTAASVDLWLVSHEELRHSARIRALSDFIAERVRDDAPLFAQGSTSAA